MHILIVGYGYLGRHLTNNKKYTFATLDKNEVNSEFNNYQIDASNLSQLEKVIKKEKPDVVIDTAANKYVDKCEQDINSSISDNITSIQNLVALKNKYNFKLIYVSTDKAVNPANIYGCEKRIAEKLVLQYGGTIVRLVNIINSTGSVLPIWKKLLENNQPIVVKGKHTSRYMMSVDEACEIIFKATEYNNCIIVPKKLKKVNIYKLAKTLTNRKNIKIEKLPNFEKVEEKITWTNEKVIKL